MNHLTKKCAHFWTDASLEKIYEWQLSARRDAQIRSHLGMQTKATVIWPHHTASDTVNTEQTSKTKY